jgi:DNA-binding beta-propeller fold protein YncE
MNVNKNISKFRINVYKGMLCCILLLLLYGCSGPGNGLFFTPENFLVWPEPPEKPRIRYLGELSTEIDLKKEKSFNFSLSELIFGKKNVGVLISPYAVAIDRDYKLFVTDTSAGIVHVFDLPKRQYRQFGKINSQESLQKPVGIAVADNWVYVVDSMLHKVCVFDNKGSFLFSFGDNQLKRPSGIAYRKDDKEVFISDTAGHSIMAFTSGGKFVREIGSRGIGPGLFNFPTQLWVDTNGKIYVSDTLNYRVQVFSDRWNPQLIFGQQGDRPGNFAHPCGIATDSYDNIYVSDRQFENIQIFNSQGQILMAFGHEGTQPGEFWLPSGICIDDHNRIYVADSFNKRIQIFQLLEQNDQ